MNLGTVVQRDGPQGGCELLKSRGNFNASEPMCIFLGRGPGALTEFHPDKGSEPLRSSGLFCHIKEQMVLGKEARELCARLPGLTEFRSEKRDSACLGHLRS